MENKIEPANRKRKPPENVKIAQGKAQLPRKAVNKQRQNPQKSRPKLVKSTAKFFWKKAVTNFVALTVLWGGAGAMGGGAWLSYQLIVDPNASIWINQFLPEWSRLPFASGKSIQTLSQIRTSLGQVGLIPGEMLLLPKEKSSEREVPDLLVPVMVERKPTTSIVCKNPCRQIVELRVYQPVQIAYQGDETEQYYRLASSVNVEGPAESFVIASHTDANDSQGSNKSLPLTTLRLFEGKVPSSGAWFNLSGQLLRADKKIPYGQVVHYNPSQTHLLSLLEWTGAAGKVPSWQQVTGGGQPELAIDQTIGLEPQFTIYQVQPRKFVPNPIQLTAISLEEPALKDPAYKAALRLARSGLWSPALGMMRALKTKAQGGWSPQAQAQLDLIKFHANVTRSQAIASWASPSQQVLADLIDGRWSEALQVFEADLGSSSEIAAMLKNDGNRLWNRVDAALKVNSQDEGAKAWGALIVAAQEGQRSAAAWLDRLPDTDGETKSRIRGLLDRLGDAVSELESFEGHTSKITGSAFPINSIDPEQWQVPEPNQGLKLAAQEVWYQVQVTSFFDGRSLVQAPFLDLDLRSFPSIQVKRFWKRLGLHNDPKIKIEVAMPNGQQKIEVATVKAFQLRDGMLRLLAAVERKSG
ncbi:hypothetical protein [Kamptonema sp. UHCC 0994]|uniref:hypothetical protein n=1 Tax=Kamptonema sp. UHCC 0994 TaxID=3031329 RepID=UPI0023B9CAAD|nr:hypothetical protein [Kamptonema sp. UHCC 0994]MDF0554825.1 hypothetical protein [Kamptonema sp. UHCC 0994]